jgi:hypothetical protein
MNVTVSTVWDECNCEYGGMNVNCEYDGMIINCENGVG